MYFFLVFFARLEFTATDKKKAKKNYNRTSSTALSAVASLPNSSLGGEDMAKISAFSGGIFAKKSVKQEKEEEERKRKEKEERKEKIVSNSTSTPVMLFVLFFFEGEKKS